MKKQIDTFLEWILIILTSVMVLNVLWQVASRYLLSSPSAFTDELAGFLLIWVGVLGSGYAAGKKLHMAIDLLPTSLEGKKKTTVEALIHVIVLVFAVLVLVIGGGNLVLNTLELEQTSSTLQVPMGYVYSVVPLTGLVMVYYSIWFLINPTEN